MKTKLNQSKLKLAIVSAMLLGTAGLSTAGYAATDGDTMAVSTTVGMVCTIDSTGDLNFSHYDTTASDDNLASASITSSCTVGGSAKITLGQGTHGTGTDAVPVRRMIGGSVANAGTFLPYSLYQEAARTTTWGNTPDTGKGFTVTNVANVSTVFGKIAKNETAGVGVFNDTVAVTLTY
jgi:spore coat protein U-like protein